MNYKIINGTLLLPDGEDKFKTSEETLWIKGNRISFEPPEDEADYEVIDASGKLIMPGLINMHTHAYMSVMRNIADDVDFNEWLFERVTPVEDSLTPEEAYWNSLFALEEMIKTGTTSFVDMHMFEGQSARAAQDAGMRGFIGRGLVGENLTNDEGAVKRLNEALSEEKEYERESRLEFLLSPHAVYSCSPELLKEINALFKEREKAKPILKQIHLSESDFEVESTLKEHGKTPVAFLSDLDFLDDKTLLAHCVKMRDDDLDIIEKSGAHVITNLASNAKLGNGFAPISEMREKGINVCLGTDGPASNNTLNMFREMGLLSLIHKGLKGDSKALPAEYVLSMATTHAAKALGKEDECATRSLVKS